MAASNPTKRAKRVSRESLSLFPDTPRWCNRCERLLPRSAFNRDSKQRDGLFPHCRECRANYKKSVYARELPVMLVRHRQRTYGLSPDQFDALLESQHGKCAICGKVMMRSRARHIDHCHATGHVRGILCVNCNTAIGLAEDDPQRLRAMADYIERHRLKDGAT